jgi:hypothetical protein
MANTNLDSLQLNGYDAADSVGLILGSGTNALPAETSSANSHFIDFRVKNTATSGDNRGMYLRQYLTGAGSGGEALRVFNTVDDVAAGTAHGAHISLNFDTSGSVTGQGIAGRFTLHMPATALSASNVTYSAIQAEIYSDAATSDPAGNYLSAFRVVNDGNATGKADVDDDCVLFDLQCWTAGAAHMFATGLTANTVNDACTAALKIRVGTTTYYIPVATAIT